MPDFLARFRAQRFGRRTERRLIARAEQRTGYPVADLDVARLGEQLESRPELLVIHDLGDRETPHEPSARLVAGWPAALLDHGLGHRRILADAAVGGTARFARLPVEPSLHAGEVPLPLPQFEQRQSSVA